MKLTTALQRLRAIARILERAAGRFLSVKEIDQIKRLATEGVPAVKRPGSSG